MIPTPRTRRFVEHPVAILTVCLALATAACNSRDAGSTNGGTVLEFETGTLRLETNAHAVEIQAEIAERPEQRTQGLMERTSLPDNAGMIFLFDEPQEIGSGFYMFRTRIPLDIAFIDESGRIVSIMGMEPCNSPNPATCRRYSPGVPYSAALEVNRNFFSHHGIDIGDRVTLIRPDGRTWPAAGAAGGASTDG